MRQRLGTPKSISVALLTVAVEAGLKEKLLAPTAHLPWILTQHDFAHYFSALHRPQFASSMRTADAILAMVDFDTAPDKALEFAGGFRKIVGAADDQKLQPKFVRAGLKRNIQADTFFACRLFGSLAGIICGSLLGSDALFWSLAAGFVGFMLPDLWLAHRIKRRRRRIQRSIPDAIDLMVICVDAGLGLDQALMRVGQELTISHPELHQELVQINLEQRAGKPRLEAWQSMADRTALPEFAALVSMLIQTDRFGTPVVRALSRFSQEIREKRRQRAEEAAAKTKIKILFPLVLFVFPCIFIVLLGPALLNLAKSFAELK